MAFYRIPGPLCVMGAMPVDSGTLVRASTPPPGPVATDMDTDFVEKVVGRNIDGTPLPLVTLRRMYDQHVRLHEEAASLFGVKSGAARFEQATVERLAELIAEAQSPRGSAAEKVRALLKKEGSDSAATDDEYRTAIAELLSAERQMELRGSPDNTGLAAMSLLAEVSKVVSERKQAEAQKVIEDAKRPNSKVTDEQLSKVAVNLLAAERQRELLGAGDDSASVSALLGEVIKVDLDRRKKRVKDAIEEFKRPGGTTEEKIRKLQKLAQEMLGSERQKELLGLEDEGATVESAGELLSQAIEITYESAKTDLRSLIEQTKRPGNKVTREQIQKSFAKVLGLERQRQLLGASGPDDDKGISDLLEQAVEIAGEREKPAPDRPVRVSVTIGQIRILSRPPSDR